MGSPSIISNPLFNMGFLLVSMQLAKKIDWEDPNVLNLARIGYYSAQVLVVALAYGLITLIKKRNGKFVCVVVCVCHLDMTTRNIFFFSWMRLESHRIFFLM
jgi:hypothetical protein